MQEQNAVGILKFGSALVVGFGAVIAMAAYPPTAGIARFLLDLVIWPVDGVQAISGPEMRLLSAVSGGVMVGWGILLWLVATRLYPKDPGLARTLILASIGTWFLADSLASIVAGVPLNALLNVSFLVLFSWPLMRTPGQLQPSKHPET
jgi:hypothetical protein